MTARRTRPKAEATAPEDPYPSIEIIRRELDLEVASQERRGSSLDTKAGLLLAFSGILVGFTRFLPTAWIAPSLIASVLAALIAVGAMLPRIAASVSPKALRDGYLTEAEDETALVLLDTRIMLYEQDEKRLMIKLRRMRAAVACLLIAIIVISSSYVQRYFEGTANNERPGQETRPATSPSISTYRP